jgi:signal transduction histidine kinase
VLIGMDNRIARVHHRTYATEWYSVPDSPLPAEPLVPVSAIVRLGEGDYLVGTEFGLYRGPLTDLTRKVRCPDSQAVRPNIDIIRSIEVEVEGGDTVAYVATWGGGVRCINLTTQHETVIDSRRGLPSNTTYAAYAAHASSGQRLLISSNAGVIVWDLQSDGVDRVLTPLQGAQSYEFNSWSHARISQGLIALGGVDGLNLCSLESMAVPPPPTVTIMRNGVSARDVWYTATAIALSGAAEVVYRYRLHDDEPWISSSDVAIHTADLSAGDYTLQVQAGYRTGGSVTYGPVTHAQWSVPVPWWRSWWSISAVAMMIAGSVWWSATAVAARRERHRSEQERLVHQERVRIARDLHDDVGTGLTRLVLLADQAEPDRASVSRIAHTAQDVIERVRSIVWVMKATDRSMLRTVEYVRSKIADMFHHAGMTFTSTVEITADGDADPMVMRSVVLALQEAATNVVRHSQASHVRMKVWCDSNVLHILLEDDGIGFDVSGSHAGNGLQHIVARASEAGGTAHIASQPGQGTVVQLTLPIKPLTPGRESS